MKIYSWNVLRSNRNLAELYGFVENLDFDVLCLQEVTEEMLVHFKTLPVYMAYQLERVLDCVQDFSKSTTEINYSVILSRYEISNTARIEFPELTRNLNSRIFEFFMKRMYQWQSQSKPGAMYADVVILNESEAKTIRVFSVHLTLWNPKTRKTEFDQVMQELPKEYNAIVCGDFNILEGPIKILNWFLGSSALEASPWYSERKEIEKSFADHTLKNPLRGNITHHFSKSQLDHILVPENSAITNAYVVSNSYGSDHQPIGVEAELVF